MSAPQPLSGGKRTHCGHVATAVFDPFRTFQGTPCTPFEGRAPPIAEPNPNCRDRSPAAPSVGFASGPRKGPNLQIHARAHRHQNNQSAYQGAAVLRSCFGSNARYSRQLQDGRNLTGAQPGQEYDLAAGKLKRVVMCVRLIGIQLPKLSYPIHDLRALAKEVQSGFILHVFLEREFRARKQTNRNAWLSDSSETTGDRPAELGRHQLVANLCGSGCDKIQAVITHRLFSSAAYSSNAPHQTRTSYNAPGESVGLRRSRVGEDTQADIPRISEVKLRFFRSRRNTIGRPSSPYRPHRSLPRVALVRAYSPDACAPALQHRTGPVVWHRSGRRCGTVPHLSPRGGIGLRSSRICLQMDCTHGS
jgi:hypothetical protein